ncbi:hypothetical protein A2U01_0046522, partial [Trifolium medium]|nr:hypothetical protein [Trifolium medium]
MRENVRGEEVGEEHRCWTDGERRRQEEERCSDEMKW